VHLRKLGFINPIACIPNGIDLSEFPLKEHLELEGQKRLLFLSRIHPKKGIEILIEAWALLRKEGKTDWLIEIAGEGDEKYINSLKNLIKEKGLEPEIQIIGPQFGSAKLATYHRADLFVLPTYSENFGIVVAEALACGIPVITTKGTPWQDILRYEAGWWIEIGVNSLKETLEEAIQLSDQERIEMGKNGRKLVMQEFSIEKVSSKMNQLYQNVILGNQLI
uniref:glycosyltransferase n=1 Tax=Algoriphagus sp. TaxID=1872435 RepID=UPI0025FC7FC5